jgi:hypothetical protein
MKVKLIGNLTMTVGKERKVIPAETVVDVKEALAKQLLEQKTAIKTTEKSESEVAAEASKSAEKKHSEGRAGSSKKKNK